jgi:hypothetical protein
MILASYRHGRRGHAQDRRPRSSLSPGRLGLPRGEVPGDHFQARGEGAGRGVCHGQGRPLHAHRQALLLRGGQFLAGDEPGRRRGERRSAPPSAGARPSQGPGRHQSPDHGLLGGAEHGAAPHGAGLDDLPWGIRRQRPRRPGFPAGRDGQARDAGGHGPQQLLAVVGSTSPGTSRRPSRTPGTTTSSSPMRPSSTAIPNVKPGSATMSP